MNCLFSPGTFVARLMAWKPQSNIVKDYYTFKSPVRTGSVRWASINHLKTESHTHRDGKQTTKTNTTITAGGFVFQSQA